jgi:hypothetical protein
MNLDDTKEPIWMIRSMVTENFTGLTGDLTEDIGLMANNMVVVSTEELTVKNERVNGLMDKNTDGLMNEIVVIHFILNLTKLHVL